MNNHIPASDRTFASELISRKRVNAFSLCPVFPFIQFYFFLFVSLCEPCRYFQPALQLCSCAVTAVWAVIISKAG